VADASNIGSARHRLELAHSGPADRRGNVLPVGAVASCSVHRGRSGLASAASGRQSIGNFHLIVVQGFQG
jgi:hypothetical protein